jgi:hypothetical protein
MRGNSSSEEWRGAIGFAREYPPKKPRSYRPICAKDIDPSEVEGGEYWIDSPEVES